MPILASRTLAVFMLALTTSVLSPAVQAAKPKGPAYTSAADADTDLNC